MEIDWNQIQILINVLIALGLSGLIGFEREHMRKPAGLRTNMIIGAAACFIVSLCLPVIDFMEVANMPEIIRTDPIRVIQALVVGISFIGAGTILKRDDKVEGLTTAATLLVSLGIGMAVAVGQYTLAVGVTLIILLINFVIRMMVNAVRSKK
jgi:putative Mg2+ transporter-C (MgtC) family protein